MPSSHTDDFVPSPHRSVPGEYDITIPPTLPTVPTSEGWQTDTGLHEQTYEVRRDSAWFHAIVTVTLVGMLTIWTMTHGEAPGLDARVGIANLILHFGAWMTGWLALDASIDAWRLHRAELVRFGAVRGDGLDHQERTALGVGALAALCLLANTAMVVSALLS